MRLSADRPESLAHATGDDWPIVEAISRGSRDAFARLFDFTSAAIRTELTARLPNADRAGAVFAATYVEVWWLAGCHSGSGIDVVEWIRHILNRRIADVGPPAGWEPTTDPWPSYAEVELANLLRRPLGSRWTA